MNILIILYLNITSLLTFDSLRLCLHIAMIGRGSRYCMITAASISTAAVCLKHGQENAVTDQEKTIQQRVSSIYSDMGKTVFHSEMQIKKCAFVLPAHYINIVGDFYTTDTELREWAERKGSRTNPLFKKNIFSNKLFYNKLHQAWTTWKEKLLL